MKKRKLIIFIIALFAITLTIGGSYAWFVEGYLSDKFVFAVAFVESKVTLYRAVDGNKDGVIERDENGMEKYVFLGDSVGGGALFDVNGEPIKTENGNAQDNSKSVVFDIDGILPTQVYTWKVAIQNIGDVQAKIFVDVNIPNNGLMNGGIDVLSFSVDGGARIYSGLSYTDNGAGGYNQLVKLINGDPVDYKTLRSEDEGKSIKEYVIAIRFASYDELVAAGVNISAEQYAAYAAKTFGGVRMSVRLEDNKT